MLDLASVASLTGNQVARLNGGLIESVENWIDAYTGRSWIAGSPVVGERHLIENGRVWLNHKPITAVSAVRIGGLFDSASLLTVTTDYVVDAARGLITFRGLSRNEVAVDYTLPQTVPADIAEAAGLIAAAWLGGATAEVGAAGTFKSITTDGQQLVWRDPVTRNEIPVTAQKLLARYCRPVLA